MPEELDNELFRPTTDDKNEERTMLLEYREQCEREYRTELEREAELNEEELRMLEERYRDIIETQRGKPERYTPFSIRVPLDIRAEMNLPELPPGVGIKGGTARTILEKTLNMERVERARDLDLAILADENRSTEENDRIQNAVMEFMRDDVRYLGIARCLSFCTVKGIDEHMREQDLTRNEVLYVDGVVYATPRAISDCAKGIIRVTEHEKEQWGGEGIGPKMMCKMLRLWAHMETEGAGGEIAELDQFDFGTIPTFWIWINLKKALLDKREVAERFWGTIVEQTMASTGGGDDELFSEGMFETIAERFPADPHRAFVGLTLMVDESVSNHEVMKYIENITAELDSSEGSDHDIEEKITAMIAKLSAQKREPPKNIPTRIPKKKLLKEERTPQRRTATRTDVEMSREDRRELPSTVILRLGRRGKR